MGHTSIDSEIDRLYGLALEEFTKERDALARRLRADGNRDDAASVAELDYHDRLLSALGLDRSHKIVLHVGSGAADPETAAARFAAGFGRLSQGAQSRLVLENDERWPLDTTLDWAERLGLPVVFDAFHQLME